MAQGLLGETVMNDVQAFQLMYARHDRIVAREKKLAAASKHLCPNMLAEELTLLQRTPEIFITHLKPGQIELTMQEIEDCIGEFRPRMLQNNQVFDL